jgi:hypothetical protein
MILRFVRIDKKARAPRFGSLGAAGADVCSVENCIVPAKGGKRSKMYSLQIKIF